MDEAIPITADERAVLLRARSGPISPSERAERQVCLNLKGRGLMLARRSSRQPLAFLLPPPSTFMLSCGGWAHLKARHDAAGLGGDDGRSLA